MNLNQVSWGEYAQCYDSLSKLRPYKRMLAEVADKILLSQHGPILDASCGTGNFEETILAMQSPRDFSIVGIDSSKEMLARAKKKCESIKCCQFFEANLDEPLPFEDGHFQQVATINTLYAVSSPEKTLREFYRVLKTNGKIHIVTPKNGYENGYILKDHCRSTLPDSFWKDAHSSSEKEERLIRTAIKEEKTIQEMLLIARHNRYIASDIHFHFFNLEDLIPLLKGVGFSITCSTMTYANQGIFITATKGTHHGT